MIGNFNEIKKEFEDTLIYSQAYPFRLNCKQLLKDWEIAKSQFIEAFGGTIWRSSEPIKVKLSEDLRRRTFNRFIEEVYREGLLYDDDFYSFLNDNIAGFFENRVVKGFPKYNIKPGSKLLKSFKKFQSNQSILRWVQDTASKYIQEDKVEGYLYLSVDPRDFLTLSENNSNWTSCHSLDGDYRAGNLSFMVDNTTIIAYIANKEKEKLKCTPNQIKCHNKKWRMLVHTNLDTNIYYSRPYPFEHETLLNIVHETISSLFFKDKLFTRPIKALSMCSFLKDNKESFLLSENERDWTPINKERANKGHLYKIYRIKDKINYKSHIGFADLIDSSVYIPTVSLKMDDKEDIDMFNIEIGKLPICPCCGEEVVTKTNSFLCDLCIAEKDADVDFYCFCSGCGAHIYEDDEAIERNGEIYCAACQAGIAGLEY